MGFFDDYRPPGFDEVIGEGRARSHYRSLVERLDSFDSSELSARVALTEAIFRRQGITFAVAEGEEGTERTWPLDLVPRIIPAGEWDHFEAGLRQRVTALNTFLDDLYAGEQAILEDGVIPRWLVESSSGYVPALTIDQ